MTFDNTKRKIKAEKLPVWLLSIINARGIPQLVAKHMDENLSLSLKRLEEEVGFFSDPKHEVCFEIKAKSKITSNGPNSELSWEFCVPPTEKKEDPKASLNCHGFDGLGALTHPFVANQLQDITSEKRRYEERREQLLKDETRVMMQEHDLKREKEYWERERKAKEDEWNRLKDQKEKELSVLMARFNDRVEAGKESLSGFADKVLMPMLADFFSGNPASGLGAAHQNETEEDKMINSIAQTIRKYKGELSKEDIEMIGRHVGKLINKIKAEKHEEAEA